MRSTRMSVPLPSKLRQRTSRICSPVAIAPPSSLPSSWPCSNFTAVCHTYAVPRSVTTTPYSSPPTSATSTAGTVIAHAIFFHKRRRFLGGGVSEPSGPRGGGPPRGSPPGGSPPGGAPPDGWSDGFSDGSVVMLKKCRRFSVMSERDTERQIRPHAAVTRAVREIDVDRADGAAPSRAQADARIEDFLVP